MTHISWSIDLNLKVVLILSDIYMLVFGAKHAHIWCKKNTTNARFPFWHLKMIKKGFGIPPNFIIYTKDKYCLTLLPQKGQNCILRAIGLKLLQINMCTSINKSNILSVNQTLHQHYQSNCIYLLFLLKLTENLCSAKTY